MSNIESIYKNTSEAKNYKFSRVYNKYINKNDYVLAKYDNSDNFLGYVYRGGNLSQILFKTSDELFKFKEEQLPIKVA